MKPLFILCDSPPKKKVQRAGINVFKSQNIEEDGMKDRKLVFIMHIGESEKKLKFQILNLVKASLRKNQLPWLLIANVK